jgi:hypothetical protein
MLPQTPFISQPPNSGAYFLDMLNFQATFTKEKVYVDLSVFPRLPYHLTVKKQKTFDPLIFQIG